MRGSVSAAVGGWVTCAARGDSDRTRGPPWDPSGFVLFRQWIREGACLAQRPLRHADIIAADSCPQARTPRISTYTSDAHSLGRHQFRGADGGSSSGPIHVLKHLKMNDSCSRARSCWSSARGRTSGSTVIQNRQLRDQEPKSGFSCHCPR